jgi:hypothetical protein
MRSRLDLKDYLLRATALLMLTLIVPALPGWFHFTGDRKLATFCGLLLGAAALWASCFRSRPLTDNRTDRIELSDWVLGVFGLFFADAMWRSLFRWSSSGMTFHRTAIVWVLGVLAVFAFYCIIDRGGLRKFAIICFGLGGILLIRGLWVLASGSVSPRFYYVYESKETMYGYLVSASVLFVSGIAARIIQKQREKPG